MNLRAVVLASVLAQCPMAMVQPDNSQPSIALWGQCGGDGWTNSCVNGANCVRESKWYAQCMPSVLASGALCAQNDPQGSIVWDYGTHCEPGTSCRAVSSRESRCVRVPGTTGTPSTNGNGNGGFPTTGGFDPTSGEIPDLSFLMKFVAAVKNEITKQLSMATDQLVIAPNKRLLADMQKQIADLQNQVFSLQKQVASLQLTIASLPKPEPIKTTLAPTIWGYQTQDPELLPPSQWSNLYPHCKGLRQSPIDIAVPWTADQKNALPLVFTGKCNDFVIAKEETTYKGTSQNGNCQVSVGGKTFHFVQFHSHVPSEHTLNGQHFDGELHFVHQTADGKDRLVIGVFVQITNKAALESNWLAAAWAAGAKLSENAPTQKVTISGSYADLITSLALPGMTFNYPGSLTTPPCDENVDWWVVKNPILVTMDHFMAFAHQLESFHLLDRGHNNRPVQPLNGRQATTYYKPMLDF